MSKKREYYVVLPIMGEIGMLVEASSEDEAKQIAMETAETRHIEQWDFKEECRGNVCSFSFFEDIADQGEVE